MSCDLCNVYKCTPEMVSNITSISATYRQATSIVSCCLALFCYYVTMHIIRCDNSIDGVIKVLSADDTASASVSSF